MAIFKDYVSLKEAGRISGYHSDYIGALVRSGKVKGKKVGKVWMVKTTDVTNHFSKKHYAPISRVFFSKKKVFFIVFAVIVVALVVFGSIVNVPHPLSTSGIISNTQISPQSAPRQSLTETVEPQSTDAEVIQASQ